MFRWLALGLAMLLPLPLVLAQDDPEKTKADKVLSVKSRLRKDDPKDKFTRKAHKVHRCELAKGTVYVIDLVSKEFDAFLRLEDPAGKQVAFDDDSGGGLNARIVYQATTSGEHRIIATSYDGKYGVYRLTVHKGTPKDVAKADPFDALIGKPAPEIVGKFSLNGETKNLADLKGKVVLLDFWAVWCGPCIRTFPHLREWAEEHQKDGLEIVGVTTYYQRFGFDKENGRLTQVGKVVKDEQTGRPAIEGGLKPGEEHDMLKDFAAHHKLKHRLMVVANSTWSEASKAYNVRGIPHAVVIDREGIIRMVRVGATPANAEALHEEIKKLLAQK